MIPALTCIILLCFISLELLSRVLIKDPDSDNFLAPCSKEAQDPYDAKGQCYTSQDEIAKMEYDTFVGYVPTENESGVGWKTNADHFRYDETFSEKKSKNEFRIFVTGGSAAWGAGVKQDQTFAHLLEKKFGVIYPQKKIRVIIAAAGAWTSAQEKVFIFNYVKKFSPDMIIMFSGWNDIYHAYTGENYNLQQDFMHYKKAIQLYVDKSEAVEQKTSNRLSYITPPKYREYHFKFLYLVNKVWYKHFFKERDILKALHTIQLSGEKIASNTLESMELIDYLSKKQKFILIYCLQPSLYTTLKKLSAWEQQLDAKFRQQYIGFPEYSVKNYGILIRAIKKDSLEKGYYFIDADDAIKQEKRSVFADYVHLGDRGNKLVANYLFDVIVKFNKNLIVKH